MTAPNQSASEAYGNSPDLAKMVGLGAFQVGNAAENFGQQITEDFVHAITVGPAALVTEAFTDIGGFIEGLANFLAALPLEALQMFRLFIPGALYDTFLTVEHAVQSIMGFFSNLGGALNLNSFVDWVGNVFGLLASEVGQVFEIVAGGIVTAISAAVQGFKDWWNFLTGQVQHLNSTGGYDAGHLVGEVAQDAVEGLTDLATNVAGAFKGIFDAWFGGHTGTGTATEVIQTVEAIKIAVENGYTLETFPTTTTGWVIPAGITELNGVCINPGQNGTNGSGGTGGTGGLGGSYVVLPLDLSVFTLGTSTLDFIVGAAGSGSGATGTTSQIKDSAGNVLLSGTAGTGGVPTPLGWTASSGSAGNGGTGGTASGSSASSGTSGTASAVAAGGAGGVGRGNSSASAVGSISGDAGTIGSNGTTNDVPLCGGGGGGGGGAAASVSATLAPSGGDGGQGGYPGGGGGGGGGAVGQYNISRGAGGIGSNGFTAVIYK